ncbi:uncharacterized protein BDZ99DRAFT_109827 [Mytilinidion resinicola]|uniref:Uncharacterized protein n=1 Tax=Mytilinidion resinicola TaxID=574789 RepID=A0A6A6YB17_9PEZI|nr:uncharacterized protein BDZ99DRAFT_109827 [Mytilinidion resinicola]KAF2805693.1 hypothetical protein BDZ99DRAFT_109827 [Mytilinidion resinicola]
MKKGGISNCQRGLPMAVRALGTFVCTRKLLNTVTQPSAFITDMDAKEYMISSISISVLKHHPPPIRRLEYSVATA